MSEEVIEVCTECDGGYLQVMVDLRMPCPFCDGTGSRARQLYNVLSGEIQPSAVGERIMHIAAKKQREFWDRLTSKA